MELVEEVMVPAMRVDEEKNIKSSRLSIPGILSSARSVQKGFEAVERGKGRLSD